MTKIKEKKKNKIKHKRGALLGLQFLISRPPYLTPCPSFSASLLLFLNPKPLNPETLNRRERERGEASASSNDDGGGDRRRMPRLAGGCSWLVSCVSRGRAVRSRGGRMCLGRDQRHRRHDGRCSEGSARGSQQEQGKKEMQKRAAATQNLKP